MVLRACRECGAQISSQAETCPHCGIQTPTRRFFDGFFKEIVSILVGGCIILGVILFVTSSRIEGQKEQDAEQSCLQEHTLTEQQTAARKHFSTCYQYRHMPSSVWSEDQRKYQLISEGCYSDDRDDPRYGDAAWEACKTR
jgi:hypothetical protein